MIERNDFAEMLNELTKALQRTCSVNLSSRLLFDNGDSASPYLKISGDRFDGCVIVRETDVTLFSKPEIDDCNVIFIREHSPSDIPRQQIHETLPTRPWTETERWMSSDGQFGFALYRHSCTVNKDGVEDE
jgi:hypothetical protein